MGDKGRKVLYAGRWISIREDHQSGGATWIGNGENLLHGEEQPIVEIRRVTRHETLNAVFDSSLVRNPLGRHEDVYGLLESDNAEDVIWAQQIDNVGAGLLDVVERWPFHGA